MLVLLVACDQPPPPPPIDSGCPDAWCEGLEGCAWHSMFRIEHLPNVLTLGEVTVPKIHFVIRRVDDLGSRERVIPLRAVDDGWSVRQECLSPSESDCALNLYNPISWCQRPGRHEIDVTLKGHPPLLIHPEDGRACLWDPNDCFDIRFVEDGISTTSTTSTL